MTAKRFRFIRDNCDAIVIFLLHGYSRLSGVC